MLRGIIYGRREEIVRHGHIVIHFCIDITVIFTTMRMISAMTARSHSIRAGSHPNHEGRRLTCNAAPVFGRA